MEQRHINNLKHFAEEVRISVESFERVARGTGNSASLRQCEMLRIMLLPVPLEGR